MNKKAISSEIIYVLAIVILAFAVNLMSMANLGMSMIVCPAYIISEKFDFLTYGQAEYLIATMVFIFFCLTRFICGDFVSEEIIEEIKKRTINKK